MEQWQGWASSRGGREWQRRGEGLADRVRVKQRASATWLMHPWCASYALIRVLWPCPVLALAGLLLPLMLWMLMLRVCRLTKQQNCGDADGNSSNLMQHLVKENGKGLDTQSKQSQEGGGSTGYEVGAKDMRAEHGEHCTSQQRGGCRRVNRLPG